MDSLLNRVRKVTASTAKSLRRELRFIEQEKQRLTAELDSAARRIADSIAQLDSSDPGRRGRGRPSFASSGVPSSGPASSGGRRKRIRRNPEQLKQYASDVYALIKKSGSSGVGGGDIRKQYPNVGQDIRAFVNKHGGHKLKTTGLKSFMRYIAA